jgi:hypothetical protein
VSLEAQRGVRRVGKRVCPVPVQRSKKLRFSPSTAAPGLADGFTLVARPHMGPAGRFQQFAGCTYPESRTQGERAFVPDLCYY